MLIDSAAAAQPTLKDVIEKSAKEEEVKGKAKEKLSAASKRTEGSCP